MNNEASTPYSDGLKELLEQVYKLGADSREYCNGDEWLQALQIIKHVISQVKTIEMMAAKNAWEQLAEQTATADRLRGALESIADHTGLFHQYPEEQDELSLVNVARKALGYEELDQCPGCNHKNCEKDREIRERNQQRIADFRASADGQAIQEMIKEMVERDRREGVSGIG